jgi:hypothetical protein
MVPHTRTILGAPTTHQDDAVLLDVVALAGDVGGNDGSRGQPDTSDLALTRIGLLGLDDTDTQAHTLHGGSFGVGQSGRDGVASALALSCAAQDLHERGVSGGCRGECARE